MVRLLHEEKIGWLASFKDLQSMAASKWKPVESDDPQVSLFGPILFIVFFNHTEYEKDCTLSEFANDTKLCGAVNTPN